MRVYLAGPIGGLHYDGATGWREYAARELAKYGIAGLSPMRAKSYLKNTTIKGGTLTHDDGSYKEWPLSTGKGITTRDRNDCMKSDVILMNLVGAERPSLGSMIELGWADAARVPIILVIEEGNLHQHAMVKEVAGFVTTDLDEALSITRALLLAEPERPVDEPFCG